MATVRLIVWTGLFVAVLIAFPAFDVEAKTDENNCLILGLDPVNRHLCDNMPRTCGLGEEFCVAKIKTRIKDVGTSGAKGGVAWGDLCPGEEVLIKSIYAPDGTWLKTGEIVNACKCGNRMFKKGLKLLAEFDGPSSISKPPVIASGPLIPELHPEKPVDVGIKPERPLTALKAEEEKQPAGWDTFWGGLGSALLGAGVQQNNMVLSVAGASTASVSFVWGDSNKWWKIGADAMGFGLGYGIASLVDRGSTKSSPPVNSPGTPAPKPPN
jgi:hypothetical protein